jgi:hypothetical protein
VKMPGIKSQQVFRVRDEYTHHNKMMFPGRCQLSYGKRV